MHRFTGTHTRKDGLRRNYAYAVKYQLEGNLLEWSAEVTCDGAAKGTPSGRLSLMLPEQQDHRAHAEFAVIAAIDHLSGVEE